MPTPKEQIITAAGAFIEGAPCLPAGLTSAERVDLASQIRALRAEIEQTTSAFVARLDAVAQSLEV